MSLIPLLAAICLVSSSVQQEAAFSWDHRVYLATYPRSGNHWMRYLIEEATGIATSSTYKDPDPQHLATIFPWGGYCCDHGYEGLSRYPIEDEPVVVKTHFPALRARSFDQFPYSKTIRIIRHPVDSFYSFYLWKTDPLTAKFLIPEEELKSSILSWRRFQEHWNSAENVLTILYEDLYNNPAIYLKLVLEAIGYQVKQEDIERAVSKYPPTGGLLKHIEHFRKKDLQLIEDELGDLISQYGYTSEF